MEPEEVRRRLKKLHPDVVEGCDLSNLKRMQGRLKHYYTRFSEDDDWNVVGLFDSILQQCAMCVWSVRRFCLADLLAIIGVTKDGMLDALAECISRCDKLKDRRVETIEDIIILVYAECGQCLYNRDCLGFHLLVDIEPKRIWLAVFRLLSRCPHST